MVSRHHRIYQWRPHVLPDQDGFSASKPKIFHILRLGCVATTDCREGKRTGGGGQIGSIDLRRGARPDYREGKRTWGRICSINLRRGARPDCREGKRTGGRICSTDLRRGATPDCREGKRTGWRICSIDLANKIHVSASRVIAFLIS